MAAILGRAAARRVLRPSVAQHWKAPLRREPCQLSFAVATDWPMARSRRRWLTSSAVSQSGVADPGKSGATIPSEPEKRSKPTISVAMAMPREPWEMTNEVLVLMAARGVPEAQIERMAREIMAVDRVSWEEAQPKLAEIRSAALESRTLYQTPYYLGVLFSTVCIICCMPMTFNHDLALWFNEHYVTADVPPEKDLETWLEVGSWTWNWVEPVIGIASFVLLLLQFSRAQMLNVRWTPYFGRIKLWKLKTVKAAYPQYNAYVLDGFLESVYVHK